MFATLAARDVLNSEAPNAVPSGAEEDGARSPPLGMRTAAATVSARLAPHAQLWMDRGHARARKADGRHRSRQAPLRLRWPERTGLPGDGASC